jgi:hypothetical protein
MVDKFTMWVEAKPLAKIGSKQAVDSIREIIFRYRVPNSIILNNGTQFTGERFLDLCDDNNIHVDWTAVALKMAMGEHPLSLVTLDPSP